MSTYYLMTLLLVAVAAAMPYPEEVAQVAEVAPLAATAEVLPGAEDELKVDERHHRRPQYSSGYGHNAGYGNTGYNTGYGNTGYGNTGYNTGYGNTGYGNTGYGNTGYGNTGYNTGYGNTGYGNTGYGNTGYGNTGYGNTGYNTGYGNTGYSNGGYGTLGWREGEKADGAAAAETPAVVDAVAVPVADSNSAAIEFKKE